MSVLFLVTRPIMSGVPIFNQMRGRFTLLLYYVALSLCAPALGDSALYMYKTVLLPKVSWKLLQVSVVVGSAYSRTCHII